MSEKGFTLVTNIYSDYPREIEPVITEIIGVDGLIRTEDDFVTFKRFMVNGPKI